MATLEFVLIQVSTRPRLSAVQTLPSIDEAKELIDLIICILHIGRLNRQRSCLSVDQKQMLLGALDDDFMHTLFPLFGVIE